MIVAFVCNIRMASALRIGSIASWRAGRHRFTCVTGRFMTAEKRAWPTPRRHAAPHHRGGGRRRESVGSEERRGTPKTTTTGEVRSFSFPPPPHARRRAGSLARVGRRPIGPPRALPHLPQSFSTRASALRAIRRSVLSAMREVAPSRSPGGERGREGGGRGRHGDGQP